MPIHHMLVFVALIACNANVNRAGIDDDDSPDAAPQEPDAVTPDARLCFGPVCLQTAPEGALENLTGTLDTTNAASCDPAITAFCVVAATRITVPPGATLAVTGSRPLVLIATELLSIQGALDAAAHATPRVAGPGAATACTPPAATPSKHGGGAGGSFGGVGGDGAGNNDNDTGGKPGATLASAAELRAGCRGQDAGTVVETTGLGGDGGGALYLYAGTTLEVLGMINASGAGGMGGRTGDDANGGGGGGSGGMIVLEAPTVTVAGMVYADGGGGGEGASHSLDGVAGADPDGTRLAAGGDGQADHGGNGGNGTHSTSLAGLAGQPGSGGSAGGGGGGGGGAGIVVLKTAPSISGAGMISPPLATAPL